MREILHLVQEKTGLNRAVVLLTKLKHFEVAQVLGFFGNSNGKDETVERVQVRQRHAGHHMAAFACNRQSGKIQVLQ